MRTLFKTIYWLVLATLIAAAAFGSVILRRSHLLETRIAHQAGLRNIDPRLFIALVARCSSNQTAFADHEHYGLLALTADEGRAWAAESGVPFDTFDLFDPEKNLRIGAWKLERSLRAWSREKDPRIWALAEWHTDGKTVSTWAAAARGSFGDTLKTIGDPSVRSFVADILQQTHRDEFTIILPWRK
jgi:hypothetical protein